MDKQHAKNLQDQSKVIHGGSHVEDHMVTRAKTMPIYQTSVFVYDNLDQVEDYLEGNPHNYMYTRLENPNHRSLEQALTLLGEGEDAVIVSSGMAAISTAIMALVEAGDHILVNQEAYGGTISLLNNELSRFGVEISYIAMKDHKEVKKHIKSNTKLILTETVTNPLLNVVDIEGLGQLTKEKGLLLVVDNTFLTPVLYKPLNHGADLEIHSLTKYINGHSDVTAGAIIGRKDLVNQCRRVYRNVGSSINPMEVWLILRGLKTLHLRMKAHSENSLELAKWLQKQPQIKRVHYPMLEDNQGYDLAKKMFPKGCGGMLTFTLHGGLKEANEFIKKTDMFAFAPSLAGVASSLSHPGKTSHRGLTEDQRQAIGIYDGTIRLSVGIEDVQDLLKDLELTLVSLS